MKLTKLYHLLACLGEESGEIQQVVGKIKRFGLHDHHPTKEMPNLEHLSREIHDLIAVYIMVKEELGISEVVWNEDGIDAKIRKVNKYMKYAREVGTLEEEE